MAGTSRDISSVITSATNNYNTRLDLSVRIKTRIGTEKSMSRYLVTETDELME